MNDQPATPLRPPGYFRAVPFLIGLGLGLVLLAGLGRMTAWRTHHRDFERYFPAISPEGSYHPTVDEMCAVVRARCRPDQILVVIGGNSIFNGVGQPAEKLWTRELQRQLGDRYAVVNLALRGAYSTDGGAVIAEVLRREFPRQIYVANTGPFSLPDPIGSETYRSLFWEAHYRGLLVSHSLRNAAIDQRWKRPSGWSELFTAGGAALSDRALRFRDLWNRVGFEKVFTAYSVYTPGWPEAMWPRSRLKDTEPDFEDFPFTSPMRFGPAKTEAEMNIVRGFTLSAYEPVAGGGWCLRPGVREELVAAARASFPGDLRARTLIVLSRNSPFYLRQLDAAEVLREDLGYRDSLEAWRVAGCAAMEYGRDFQETDYGDRTHLSVTGGRKLAVLVSEKIRTMAAHLGYWVDKNHE